MPLTAGDLQRRTFLAALASTAAACRTPPTSTASPSVAPAEPPPPLKTRVTAVGITQETFAEAEKLMGIRYTDAERDQMLDTVEDLVALWSKRRGRSLDINRAPATVFEPVIQGTSRPQGPVEVKLRAPSGAAPSTDEDYAFATIPQLGAWLRTGVVTSRRLTELYLQRLAELGSRLECVVTTVPEHALAQADRADEELRQGRDRGPLHGIPWGAKDLLDTAGIPTTWGAQPYRERVPQTDAVVVSRLADAGAVLAAKLSSGALAYGDVWYGGRTRNPWNLNEGSTGSSSGPAAAVAAGLVGFAIGTETFGSIIAPALRCGVVGLRPTFGRVARTGCMPLSWSMDKIGPITRSVEGAMAVLAAINGADPADPGSRDAALSYDGNLELPKLRIGYDPTWYASSEVTDVERDALARVLQFGLPVEEIQMPDLPYSALMAILLVEAASAHEDLTQSDRDDELVWQGDDAWPNTMRWSRFISGVDYVAAQRIRREVMEAFARIFDRVDVLVGPATAPDLSLATNCTGHPGLALRAGFVERHPLPFTDGELGDDLSPARVPQGIRVWGRLFDEGRLCRFGLAIEAGLSVGRERPPLS